MPGEDYDDADDLGPSSPLHPDDRLWRHPSEMARLGPSGGPWPIGPDPDEVPTVTRRRAPWALLVTSSLVGASVAVVAILVTGLGERVIEREIVQPASVVPAVTTEPPATPTTVASNGLAEIVDRVLPALARIQVSAGEVTVYGSAVAIRADGLLLTDAAALAAGGDIEVRLADGRRLPGTVVAVDPVTELAVIRVEADDLVVAEPAERATLHIGEVAVAVGLHDGGGPTLSAGVVSATGVRVRRTDGTTLHGMIQTDAAIPEPSAGGVLVTAEGAVIGLTARVGAGTPFGIATPIAVALDVARELIEHGRALHPWLGIEGRDGPSGPVVVTVIDAGPAAAGGLTADDVILRIDEVDVVSMSSLVVALRAHEPGDTVTVAFRRGGEDQTCRVVLAERG